MKKTANTQTANAGTPARSKIEAPENLNKLLLHSCCAPCVGEIMEALLFSEIDYSIYFYNPNIHPRKEYLLRKESNIEFAIKHNIEFIDADYDAKNWFERTKGMEMEPERGIRCTECFDMRLEKTAEYAHQNNFNTIATSLGISRWKNLQQIDSCGQKAVLPYENLTYWDFNWRKKGGSTRMIEISKRENFYQQEYCGCVHSLRDTNNYKISKGEEPIKIGIKYYSKDN